MIQREQLSYLKALKYPHTRIILVAEAICILYAKKPSYENFIKLINQNDFIFKFYDINNISDYTMSELKKYIDNPEFSVEKIAFASQMCSYLCSWVTLLYNYNLLHQQVNSFNFIKIKIFKTKFEKVFKIFIQVLIGSDISIGTAIITISIDRHGHR